MSGFRVQGCQDYLVSKAMLAATMATSEHAQHLQHPLVAWEVGLEAVVLP
jgi:hypothetical protein